MRALVVYESMFGNTQAVAKAIGDGLSAVMPVEVVEVGIAPTVLDAEVGLLVVGGPTHAFGMTRAPRSAARAVEKRLRRLGFELARPAESFYVHGKVGPLVDGEVDRAEGWGEELAPH